MSPAWSEAECRERAPENPSPGGTVDLSPGPPWLAEKWDATAPWIPLTKRANPAKNVDSAGGMFRTSGFRSGSRCPGGKSYT